MPDFKFSCPHCDQHISADSSWSGREILCPACKTSITVPAAPAPPAAPLNIRIHKRAPEPPPLKSAPTQSQTEPAPARTPSRAPQGSWCGLAIASLVTGLLFCTSPAAVICGHLALGKFKHNPRLQGRWMAITGLILGYLGVLATVVILMGVGGALLKARKEFQGMQSANTLSISESGQEGTGDAPTDLRPPPEADEIPTATVSGTIDGGAVTCGYAMVSDNQLEFRKSDNTATDPWIVFFLHGSTGTLEEATWIIPDGSDSHSPTPSVHVHYRNGNQSGSFVLSRGDYTLRLEFGQASGGKLPGKVFLQADKPKPIKLEGSFNAVMK